MTVLAQRHSTTTESLRAAAPRDLPAWEARVRRILRPAAVELVDGSSAQRRRLVAAGERQGTFRIPADLPASAEVSALPLDALLAPGLHDLRDVDVVAGPGTAEPADEEQREAEALRLLSGAARGRTAWVVPFAVHLVPPVDAAAPSGPELGVLFTDSPVAVLSVQEEAQVGAAALERITAGEPWTALVHSMGLPLDDEHGGPLRDDEPWPAGARLRVRLRGGSEVWSCGSPVAWT